jgi:N-acetylglucosaminyldiphosphoundecaprenol N-acetyl-beta-D-mannosaminyltransferase
MYSRIINSLNILSLKISKVNFSDLLNIINKAIVNAAQLTITGANVSTINLSLEHTSFKNNIDNIDYIHPDGIGIFLASKFLYGEKGFSFRFTGSDFYTELIKFSKKQKYSFFFFGDRDETLNKINNVHPDLLIKGLQNGFNFENEALIKTINSSLADILLVGLGSPKQEKWIFENKQAIDTKVLIAVGDGIKIFSKTKKRGPKILQKIGLEWAVRLFFEPKRLWKRYIIGIPLFIFRIVRFKFSSKNS